MGLLFSPFMPIISTFDASCGIIFNRFNNCCYYYIFGYYCFDFDCCLALCMLLRYVLFFHSCCILLCILPLHVPTFYILRIVHLHYCYSHYCYCFVGIDFVVSYLGILLPC